MHFLLTRPQTDNQRLSDILTALGHEVSLSPLLTIDYLSQKSMNINNFQAILFTSANGVRAYAHHNPSRAIACYGACFCVGQATATQAQKAGFKDISSANGDVDKLAQLVCQKLSPAGGPLLHISGKDQAGSLTDDLTGKGFTIQNSQLYKAHKSSALSPEIIQMITQGQISHMPFYSPRTARTFMALAQKANLQNHLSKISALCLSPVISHMIDCLTWKDILIAGKPDQKSLFNLVHISLEEGQT